jgi:ABC-type amino acid transport substrate-binding protein
MGLMGFGQEATLKVGVKVEPPFVIRESGGSYSGLSVDLWKSIAERCRCEL